jgi:hypothetical protein
MILSKKNPENFSDGIKSYWRVVNPKKVRTRWIWAPAGLACATTNPAGWLFRQLFFVYFLFLQKESKEK